jgi:ketosteroid isomerase-like protein
MDRDHDEEVRALLDRAAIRDVIDRYSDAVTRGDHDRMATLFAPDAVWESPALGLHFDRASEFIDMQIEGSPRMDVLIQTAHNPVIELEAGDRATATTTIHERIRGAASDTPSALAEAGAALNVEQYGIYFDELGRFDGGWKFTHRLFAPIVVASGTVTGDTVTHRRILAPPR